MDAYVKLILVNMLASKTDKQIKQLQEWIENPFSRIELFDLIKHELQRRGI
jgi:hypothetical protein